MALYSADWVRKLDAAMRRVGREDGRNPAARQMPQARPRGAIRGRKSITTTPAVKAAGLLPDLMKRRFTTEAPNRLRAADISFVATWSGSASAVLMIGGFRRKVAG